MPMSQLTVVLFTLAFHSGRGIGTIPIDKGAAAQHAAVLQKAHERLQAECHSGDSDATAKHAKKCSAQRNAKQLHAFNQQVSDRLPLDRPIPDTRANSCGALQYNITSSVSVVIPFHHEATSTLLRTAKSVLSRTPNNLLTEVIIVNDGADSPWASLQRKQLAKYAEKNPKVKIINMEQHLGLAPAKVAGAKQATGDIVAFLDSHCEVNIGWYEPMAAAIEEDRGTIANPVIDGISSEDFSYHGTGQFTKGVFTWGMYFAGEPFPKEDQAALRAGRNVPTVAMPGGLFAVDRAYFEKLGFYDEGLRVWGGENIELSLKAWRCAGRVLFVPCSRVGHVYKAVNHQFPSGESLHKNYKRIAEVWLDEYKEIYYKSFPKARTLAPGDLTQAHAVRQRLDCKPMSWFIENIYPTLFVPAPVIDEGLLKAGSSCVSTGGVEIASNPRQNPHIVDASLHRCDALSDHNQWYFMKESQRLVHIGIWTEECLGARGSRVVVCQCARYPGSGCTEDEIRWRRSDDGLTLQHDKTGLCLQAAKKQRLLVAKCATNPTVGQKWSFVNRTLPQVKSDEL